MVSRQEHPFPFTLGSFRQKLVGILLESIHKVYFVRNGNLVTMERREKLSDSGKVSLDTKHLETAFEVAPPEAPRGVASRSFAS